MPSPRALLVLPFLLGTAPVLAQAPTVQCDALPNIIAAYGGSDLKPLVRDIAIALASAPEPETLIYSATQGVCGGFSALLAESPTGVPTYTYWNESGQEGTCNNDGGVIAPTFVARIGPAPWCANVTPEQALTLRELVGPVASVSLIVPSSSSELAISAEAAHFILRYGPANSGVAPWSGGVKEDLVLFHNASSGRHNILALTAGLPRTFSFTGDHPNNPGIDKVALRGAINPNVVLSYTGTEVAQENDGIIRQLAYQHTGQHHAYWPDSGHNTRDRRNVRNGTYYLWDHVFFYARGAPDSDELESEGAARFFSFLEGAEPFPGDVPLEAIISENGLVPTCAMHVDRVPGLGPLYSTSHEAPCDALFEAHAGVELAVTPTLCTGVEGTPGTCPGTGGANVCRRGYCEAW